MRDYVVLLARHGKEGSTFSTDYIAPRQSEGT